MEQLAWLGVPPSPKMRTALEAAGWSVVRGRSPPPAAIVSCTRDAVPPELPRADAPWLWLSLSTIPAAAATEAVLRGAYDALSLFPVDDARSLVTRLDELRASRVHVPHAPSFVAHSAAARRVLERIAQVAPTAQPVLLTGETGTGKEVTARLIHAWSQRNEGRFVPINCAAIPNELMEAELFGYSKGAFSGAVQRFDGQLMAAAGGTVFLDEIDDTPLSTQVKLLRVLEDRVVQRLGESEPHRIDFRILAATNRDLRPLIANASFGADFYERLAIVSIHLPPLRERIEDLPALATFFIERFHADEAGSRIGDPVRGISSDALAALAAYSWPGNIRELRNVLFEALVYKRAGDELRLSDLPRRVLTKLPDAERQATRTDALVDPSLIARRIAGGRFDLRREVERLERSALEQALRKAEGNAAEAARLLGRVGRGEASDPGGTVRAMMKRLGVRASR